MNEQSAPQIRFSREQVLKFLTGYYQSRGRVPTLEELVEWELVDPEDVTWLRRKLEDELNLRERGIEERKLNRAKEKAKVLSTNREFVDKVLLLRARWEIQPRLPEVGLLPEQLAPENILRYWTIGESNTSEEKLHRLTTELQTELCEPFGLNWFHFKGMVVGALCFGLTRENIIEHWDRISLTLAQDISPGVTMERRTKWSDERLIPFLTVRSLLKLLEKSGISKQDLPAGIRECVEYVLKLPHQPTQLLLHIEATTTHEDIDNTWQQVQWHQRDLWGLQQPETEDWPKYERDTFMWLLREPAKPKITYRGAYEEWLSLHPDERKRGVQDSAIGKALRKIKFLWTNKYKT